MYKAIQTSRVYEEIVKQIEASILSGELRPGDQLPAERDLAKQFSVSRTAVREAVRTLHQKGLVEAYAGRGTFITSGTSRGILQSFNLISKLRQPELGNQLIELRAILEPEIAALAAIHSDEQHRAAMAEAIDDMDHSLKDPEAFIEADLDFHLALAEAGGNPLILSLIDSFVGLLRDERMRIFRIEGGPERGQAWHKVIFKAVQERDSAKARHAMKVHMRIFSPTLEGSPISERFKALLRDDT